MLHRCTSTSLVPVLVNSFTVTKRSDWKLNTRTNEAGVTFIFFTTYEEG